MQTGRQEIDGEWYYFDASGAMQTGWEQISGVWYYFDASGAMQTGWQEISNKRYYFYSGGEMATGWTQIGYETYYFYSDGAMAANAWVGDYYLKANGTLARNEWVDNNRYYVDGNGKWVPGKNKNQSSTVYWVPNGEVYHTHIGCRSLARSTTILSGTLEQARQAGKTRLCRNCEAMDT